ncbi:transposon Ty3-I Gag-Pol polyprotein [Trichonephila clavipes]|nr:transposon Ty3-I Gag-Pol polyprotein [Trichonephila clavipes]
MHLREGHLVSGAAQNFQTAIDIILKPIIGKFVSVYMNDIIIEAPSFEWHVEYLKEVFRSLQEDGLMLNQQKSHFACEKFKYLGLVMSHEGVRTDDSKVKGTAEMKLPKNAHEVAKVLLGFKGLCREV